MPRFKIPERFQNGFKYYNSLSAKLKSELYKNIENAPVGMSSSDLANYLTSKVNIDKPKLEEIIETIYSLFTLKDEMPEVDLKTIASEISIALKSIDISASDDLPENIIKLLSIKDSITITRKASDLAIDRQNILSSTRILTDIRPVFGIEKEDEIKSVIVIHNLRIEYGEGFRKKRIYFALDNEDLKKRLKKDITKAENKEKAIIKAI